MKKLEVISCTECAYDPTQEDPRYYNKEGCFICPFCNVGHITVEFKIYEN